MDELLVVKLLFGGAGTYALGQSFRLPQLIRDWRAFRQWQRAQSSSPAAETSGPGQASLPHLTTPAKRLAGAGWAMETPPQLSRTIAEMVRLLPNAQYRIPLGWSVDNTGRASLSCGALVNDINHIAVTGQSDMGKDNAVRSMLFSLTALHRPSEVQVCILDGKGLDFSDWLPKAHTWRVARRPEEIKPAMEALTGERERRFSMLDKAGVKKWEKYTGGDLPLLVVYISELSLLADALPTRAALEQWLNSELAAGRAFGIRFIVGTQNLSNYGTRWRSQISCFLATFQPDASQDAPNTGLETKQIRERGAIPPSQLPGAPIGKGVFTLACGGMVATLRFPLVTDEEIAARLDRMPDRVVQADDDEFGLSGIEAPAFAAAPPVPVAAAVQTAGLVPRRAPEAASMVVAASLAAAPASGEIPRMIEPASSAPSPAGAVGDDLVERTAYAIFLMETQRERELAAAIERAGARASAPEEERAAYAIYLIDKKQVDGVSRAVERAWNVKRGGGSTFKNAKTRVETLMAQRPGVQSLTTA
ncbi:MAG: FtsK/SpoIIIE domain-containing protein [Chloroflexota bacterium]|nr:FtsK/SpoIIIE domain-containing protein [Chloroflexota bacterium]